jgi:hypothetical protein
MGDATDPELNSVRLRTIWRRLGERLGEWNPDWRAQTGVDAPRPALRSADGGPPVANSEAFEALAVALVSGNTRWDRIEPVRGELDEPLCGFDPAAFARLSDEAIAHDVLPWFRRRRAGSAGLRAGLMRLRQTADLISGGGRFASADAMIRAALAHAGGSPEMLAMLLGDSKDWKLPGFGIALAAEALRLMGFDLCKPDRHVTRAVGSWSLASFARWDKRGAFTAPQAKPKELLETMLAVRNLAQANGVATTVASSVIWTAGAVSGARLTNAEFARIAAPARRGA